MKPRLQRVGYGRVLQSIGNGDCILISELKACEKLVLHQPTGVVFLACSTPDSRVLWTPAASRFNSTGASRHDYVATYDPRTSRISPLELLNFPSSRGLSLHGMDVVPSSSNPSELFVYLINHRTPLGTRPASEVGADSVIEVFKTAIGSTNLTHIKTVEDSIIITPNDLVGSADGKSFYFTNDHGAKVGLVRLLSIFGHSMTSIGYCHFDKGCHFAIQNMHANNGIAKAPNGTVYVANWIAGGLTILEEQADNTLVVKDFVPTDRPMDNLSVDSNGFVWAAGFPSVFHLFKHLSNPSVPCPSSALRFSINTNTQEVAFGSKYKVEKAFEDDGIRASGITSVAYDAERNHLYLHGLASPNLAVCKL